MQISPIRGKEEQQILSHEKEYIQSLKVAENLAKELEGKSKDQMELNKRDDFHEVFQVYRSQEEMPTAPPFKIIRNKIKSRIKVEGGQNKNLTCLTVDLIKFFFRNRDKECTLDNVSEYLAIEKRKIYDLVNLFSSFHLIKRVGKGNYVWNGAFGMEKRLRKALDENEDEIEPQKEGKSLKIEEGGESLVNTEQLQKHKPKEKSLGIIAFNFLKLLQKENTLTIENAAEILSRNLEPNKFKTKIRRLYDVSKVLLTLKIIMQVSINKRSSLRWLGLRSLSKTISDMVNEVDHSVAKTLTYSPEPGHPIQPSDAGPSFLFLVEMLSKKTQKSPLQSVQKEKSEDDLKKIIDGMNIAFPKLKSGEKCNSKAI